MNADLVAAITRQLVTPSCRAAPASPPWDASAAPHAPAQPEDWEWLESWALFADEARLVG
ncbi:MAG: hypothetical protein EOO78_23275 [Oxalobacteraceae bacterium]|nr:MAG: hypothetical protein EOO78_23275 [Oxalobacteraceae bacterium]